jgi:hypothetical protein
MKGCSGGGGDKAQLSFFAQSQPNHSIQWDYGPKEGRLSRTLARQFSGLFFKIYYWYGMYRYFNL